MKTFAVSLAVWGVLALASMQLAWSLHAAYWSGIGLVLFWIVVATVWLFRQPQRASTPAIKDRPEDGPHKDHQDNREGKDKDHVWGTGNGRRADSRSLRSDQA